MKHPILRLILFAICSLGFGDAATADETSFYAMARRLHMHMEERGMGIISYRTGNKAFESFVDPGPCFVPSDPKVRAAAEKRLAALRAKEGPWMDFSYTSPTQGVSLETINTWNSSYRHRVATAYLYNKRDVCLDATFWLEKESPNSTPENFIKRYAIEIDELNIFIKKSLKN